MVIKNKNFKIPILFQLATGTFPFTMTVNRFQLSIPLLSYGILLRIVFCCFCVTIVVNFLKKGQQSAETKFFFRSVSVNMVIVYLFTVVSFICIITKNKLLKYAIKAIRKVDKELYKVGISTFIELKPIIHLLILLVGWGPGVVRSLFVVTSLTEKFLVGFFFIYLTTSFYISLYPFIEMVDLVRGRFWALKEGFLRLPPSMIEPERLVTAIKLHCILCSTSKILNKCFNLQLLFMYLVVFLLVVSNSYTLLEAIRFDDVTLGIVRSTFIVFYASVGYLVVYLCTKASLEAKEFSTLLYQLMIENKSNEISGNKKLSLHISMKREVVFTAFGFFRLDYTLIHSMIAATTTYLVILIQFGQHSYDGQLTDSPDLYNTTSSDSLVTGWPAFVTTSV